MSSYVAYGWRVCTRDTIRALICSRVACLARRSRLVLHQQQARIGMSALEPVGLLGRGRGTVGIEPDANPQAVTKDAHKTQDQIKVVIKDEDE
jgi:hypothetical protein